MLPRIIYTLEPSKLPLVLANFGGEVKEIEIGLHIA